MGSLTLTDTESRMIMKVLCALLFLFGLTTSLPDKAQGEDDSLICAVCLDIVTDLDSWLTSDATEAEIVEWVSRICKTLAQLISPDIETMCNVVIGSQIPAVIDGLVEENLEPHQVCQSIGACTAS